MVTSNYFYQGVLRGIMRSSFYLALLFVSQVSIIMELITMIVQYKVKKKKLAKVKDALSEYMEAVKKNEPGTTDYKVFQDGKDNTSFIHLMTFVDKNAKKTHEKTEHLKKLKKILIPISKGKAVYTTLVEVLPTKSQEKTEETTKDESSHEPI